MSSGPEIVSYGPHESQYVERWSAPKPRAVAFLIHGGYWRARYACDLMHPMARQLVGQSVEVVNVEYRRVGEVDDPWPAMSDDIETAWRLAADWAHHLPIVPIGHSAGGHLAMWLGAGSGRLGRRADLIIALAPVADLHEADVRSLSDGAVRELMGGSAAERPDRYAGGSPQTMLPLGVPTLVVHGDADVNVPPDMADAYIAAAAAAGDEVLVLRPVGVDHFDVIDPATGVWSDIEAELWGSIGADDIFD